MKRQEYYEMTKEERKGYLKGLILEYLRMKGCNAVYGKSINCPLPTHDDIHPSAVVYEDSQRLYCFACNPKGYDIFDLVYIFEGSYYNTYSRQTKFLEDLFLR